MTLGVSTGAGDARPLPYSPPPEDDGVPSSPAAALARRTASFAEAGPLYPRMLTTRVGVTCGVVIGISAAVQALAFLPVTVPGLRGLLAELPAWMTVPALLMVVLPLVFGLMCIGGLVLTGHHPFRRPSEPPVIDPDDPLDLQPLRRAIPAIRGAVLVAFVQALSFYLVVGGAVVVLVAQGRASTLDPSVVDAVNLWVCVQTSLLLAVHDGRLREARLLLTVVTIAVFAAVMPDLPAQERVVLVVDPLILAVLVYSALRFILEVGSVSIALQADRLRREGASSALDSAVTEAGRIEDLIHDNILSCLLLTARGGAEDEWASGAIKRHAASALETLDEIARPTDALDIAPVHVDALTHKLVEHVRAMDPHITLVTHGRRRSPVPAEVAHALSAAALEAVRNSLRHAAPPASAASVRRRLSLTLSEESVSLEVDDNGVGFDPRTLPPRSAGMRASILRRVQKLPGGHAGVASAPNQGTAVHLSWTDPRRWEDGAPDPATGSRRRSTDDGPDESLNFRLRDRGLTALIALTAALLAVSMIVTLPFYDPWWPSLLAFVLLCAFGAALTHRWSTPTGAPPRWTWPWWGLVAPIMLALTLASYSGEGFRDTTVWTLTSSTLVLVMLALSRYTVAAWLGGVCYGAVLAAWSFHTGQPDAPWTGEWPVLLVAIGLSSFMGRWATSRIEASAEIQAERERRIAQDVAQTAVLRQRRTRSTELDMVVRPLVTQLASDAPVTPAMELEAGLLEARLRDDMRARCFHGTDVARAAWEARGRGVVVELMDDGGLESASSVLIDAVVTLVAQRIDLALDGQVTVRVLPQDRDVVASILFRPGTGDTARTEIFEDGHARTEFGG